MSRSRLNITLDAELLARVDAARAGSGEDRSAMIERALRALLDAPEDPRGALRAALNAATDAERRLP